MRVAIVNDVEHDLETLRRIVESIPGYEVAWLARDGEEAVARFPLEVPDAVLMDLHMPGMNGVEATRRLMALYPRPIMIVASSVESNVSMVFEAMGHGAMDALTIPCCHPEGQAKGEQLLLKKLETLKKLVAPHKRVQDGAGQDLPKPSNPNLPYLVAIGTSTGGPKALAAILGALPPDFPAAVVVVQHVDSQFIRSLVTWLGDQSRLPVRLAPEGYAVEKSVACVAGTDRHLVMRENAVLGYEPAADDDLHRPSVDVFFRTLVRHWPNKGLAVLLTGMGRDGAAGLLALRQAGWRTLAQDQATCVVYGMPKAAVELQAVDAVLPLDRIAPELLRWVHAQPVCT